MKTNVCINYTQPLLAEVYAHNRFRGTYYLTGFVARTDKHKSTFWEIILSDASSNLKVYCRDPSCIFGELQPQSLVDIEANVDLKAEQPYFRCKFIQPSSVDISKPKRLSQLPISLCSKPNALADLLGLVESITEPLLSEFVVNVLTQSNIGLQFIQCPASVNHHHNYHSGLLEHSVEVAFQFTEQLEQIRSAQERDLGIVAALLHDIGKTQTFTSHGQRTDIGYVVDHNDLTLEICAPALIILEAKDKGLAMQLRHAWTCGSENARYGFKAKTQTAELLKKFDRKSSADASSASN